jgi:hypothetical protein
MLVLAAMNGHTADRMARCIAAHARRSEVVVGKKNGEAARPRGGRRWNDERKIAEATQHIWAREYYTYTLHIWG